ncbi:hypothetical protein NUW58_g10038 [Xylaria curta]|uniref:Uncharacterized protein n=1 Tax=Xylaria curta TaxID=42375 RepID=A0ACC1MQD9_9PEZI|nr:hypothetical protein NUW58_g10038 [Xylaria curta]
MPPPPVRVVTLGESNSDEESPTHNRPWPDVDPFAQGRFERKFLAEGETINFDSLPNLPFFASWFGISERFRTLSVLTHVSNHSSAVQRPLTGAEASAISEMAVHSVRWLAWTNPVSLGLAIAAAAAGRRTFKFPFYKPKMQKFDPNSFPSKMLPILKGPHAAYMWHVTRAFAYMSLVWIPTAIFFKSAASTSFQAHALRDPRLASFIEEARRNAQRQQSRAITGMPYPRGTVPPSQDSQHTSDGAHQDNPRSEEYGSTGHAAQPSTTSPTTYPSWSRNPSAQPAPHRTQDDDSDLFDNDDASPVAPSARASGGQGPSSSSGSSWDRLRQQARSGSLNWERGDSSGQEQGWAQLRQDKTRNTRDSTPKTDSYSYSSDDEEREKRSYEREQAQKEFDALLEAERRGGGGNSGSGRSWPK